jgi:2-aminoadipate transaminase
LQYGSTAGDPALRKLTAEYLATRDAVDSNAYSPEAMIITHGSQQLLYLVTEALCDPGDIVLVEDPTYFVYLAILESHGVQARGVKLDSDGLNLTALEATLEKLKAEGRLPQVKMLYIVSYFQNPSGVTTTFEKKQAMLRLLKRYEKSAGHPIYLLEDAAYRDLRFEGDDQASALAATSNNPRTIYAGTFSKPYATGIRVGYGLMPAPLAEVVARIKGNHDFGTSNLLQQILLGALRTRLYHQHVKVLQERYRLKAGIMAEAITRHFPGNVRWSPANGGLYVWAGLPGVSAGRESLVFKQALKQDVLYVPGELCYADDPSRPKPTHEMRISFGGALETNIREGIKRLGTVLKRHLN